MNNENPKIFVISGSAGAGKDSVLAAIQEKNLNLYWAITTTSKEPRKDESRGKPYYFISKEEFQELIRQDGFLEYENVYDDKYFGMTREEIEKALESGKNILWQLDYRGYRKIKKIFPGQTISIFILPPSLEIAEKRIRNRSTIDEDFIKERLELSKKEFKASKEYDYAIINEEGKLDETIEKVLEIIKKEA